MIDAERPAMIFADAVSVRPLDVDDLAAVRRLQISSFKKLAAGCYSKHEADAFAAHLSSDTYAAERYRATTQGELLGVAHDGTLIGSGEWSRPNGTAVTAQLGAVYVHPLFAGCGLGERIVCELETCIGQAGYTDLSLRSTVNATGFFERLGYHVTSHGQHTLSSSASLAVAFMRKTLAPVTSIVA